MTDGSNCNFKPAPVYVSPVNSDLMHCQFGSLQKMDTPFMGRIPAKLQHYWPDMWQVMAFSWQQATTMPTGLHAEFIRQGIDAVTIETYMQPSAVSFIQSADSRVFSW